MWPSPKKGCMPKSAGVAKWLKAQGLGPCHEGVRGFDSRPPHLRNYIIYHILAMNCLLKDVQR